MQIKVLTDHPIAYESRDHTHPGGTSCDNSRFHAFNEKLYALHPDTKLSVADLGCSGGGFVKDCLDDGHFSVGLEGSDYSLVRKRAEWATIPDNLFTADITKPFTIYDEEVGEAPILFDYVTAWEVMEHILEQDLPGLSDNVARHLATNGRWIMSVSKQIGEHHVTVRPREWWLNFFQSRGWQHHQDLVDYFGDDWIRGPKQNAPESFHLILSRKAEKVE